MVALTPTVSLLTSSNASQTMDAARTLAPEVTIAVLTAALTKGEEQAFREFHKLYFDRLFRYHVVIARGDEDAACEALQETFLRVVRNVRRFDNEETFWSWLTVLCRSAAADRGRKQQRYWKLLANYARSLLPLSPDNHRPDDAGETLHEVLTQSLEELGGDERSLVEGKYFRRASIKELAEETGLSEKAVESRLLRARRELRERISRRLKHEKA